MHLITSLETFINNKILSYGIFFSERKTLYHILSNYVQQYLQTIRIENNSAKEKTTEF